MKNDKKTKNFIKTTFIEFLNEEKDVDNTYIKDVRYKDKNLKLHKVYNNPMKVLYWLETMQGESYIDINTILETNLLVDAIWVKIGGDEEKIADSLDFLEKTNKTTKSGYNSYVMYNITD